MQNKEISKDITQHRDDAEKTITELKVMRSNIDRSGEDWNKIVTARIEHLKSFIESLDKQEKEFEHFK